MKIKIKNLDHLNDTMFYSGMGCSKDLVLIMNKDTLKTLTDNFKQKYKEKFGIYWYSDYEDPDWFAQHNGVPMAIGDWLDYMEVDIRL